MLYYPVVGENKFGFKNVQQSFDSRESSGAGEEDEEMSSRFGPIGSAPTKMRSKFMGGNGMCYIPPISSEGGELDCGGSRLHRVLHNRAEKAKETERYDSSREVDGLMYKDKIDSAFNQITLPTSFMRTKELEDPVFFESGHSATTDRNGSFGRPGMDDNHYQTILYSKYQEGMEQQRRELQPSNNRFNAPVNAAPPSNNQKFMSTDKWGHFWDTPGYTWEDDNGVDLQALSSTLEALQVFSVRNDVDGAASNFRLSGWDDEYSNVRVERTELIPPSSDGFSFDTSNKKQSRSVYDAISDSLTFEESFGAVSAECDRVVRIIEVIKDFSETLKSSSNDIDQYHIDNALVENVLIWLCNSTQKITSIMQSVLFLPSQCATHATGTPTKCRSPPSELKVTSNASSSTHPPVGSIRNVIDEAKLKYSKSEKAVAQHCAASKTKQSRTQPANEKSFDRPIATLEKSGSSNNNSIAEMKSSVYMKMIDDPQMQRESQMNAVLLDTARAKTMLSITSDESQSQLHESGRCKPCVFCYNKKKGCKNGADCQFCHHEDHGKHPLKQWKKQQQKQLLASRSAAKEAEARVSAAGEVQITVSKKKVQSGIASDILGNSKHSECGCLAKFTDPLTLPWLEKISKHNNCSVDNMSSLSTNYVESDSSFSIGTREFSYQSLLSRR